MTIIANCLETAYCVGEYTKSCPDFRYLVLTWARRITTVEDSSLDLYSLAPCPNVEYLDLYSISLSKKTLEYIMYAFPNIKGLTIATVSALEDPNDFTTSFTSDLWTQFLVYLNARSWKRILARSLYIHDIPGVLADHFRTIKSKRKLSIVYDNERSQPVVDINTDSPAEETRAPEGTDLDFLLTAVYQEAQHETELPFIPFLRRAGGYLKSLRFNTFLFNESVTRFNNSFLIAICQHCPSMVELIISKDSFSNCSQEPLTNTSIKKLTMVQCDLPSEFFPQLSVRLPSLSILRILNYRRVGSNGDFQKEYHNYIIEMPNTSFNTLSWQRNHSYFDRISYSDVYLKIVTDATSDYYCANGQTGVVETSDISFQKS